MFTFDAEQLMELLPAAQYFTQSVWSQNDHPNQTALLVLTDTISLLELEGRLQEVSAFTRTWQQVHIP